MSRPVTIRRTDTVIHVNRGKIDGNRKHQRDEPPLTMRKGRAGRSSYSDRIIIYDQDGRPAGEVVYNKAGILPCGAKAVIIAYHGAALDQVEGASE
jgi:hypothetical protein